MKFYRTITDGHIQLWKTQAEIPKGSEYDVMEIPTDKDGLHSLVQELLDNLFVTQRTLKSEQALLEKHKIGEFYGNQEEGSTDRNSKPVSTTITNYADWSVAIDDAWDELPLSRRLEFVASTITEARTALVSAGISERDRKEGGRGIPQGLSKD